MKDIFEFNHIDKKLPQKIWCFKKSYKHFKRLDETTSIAGVCLVIMGTITGGITQNPIILGVVNGAGYTNKFWKNEEL